MLLILIRHIIPYSLEAFSIIQATQILKIIEFRTYVTTSVGQFVIQIFLKCCLDPVLRSWLEASQFSFFVPLIKSTYQQLPLWGLTLRGYYIPTLTASKTRFRRLGTAPMTWSLENDSN